MLCFWQQVMLCLWRCHVMILEGHVLFCFWNVMSCLLNPYNTSGYYRKWVVTIDISWVDYPYKASTCDVMYWRQRRHSYYGGQIWKQYLSPSLRSYCLPQPQFLHHGRAVMSTNSKGAQSVYSIKNPKTVYNVQCMWSWHVLVCKTASSQCQRRITCL
jgi:hypothetical protein